MHYEVSVAHRLCVCVCVCVCACARVHVCVCVCVDNDYVMQGKSTISIDDDALTLNELCTWKWINFFFYKFNGTACAPIMQARSHGGVLDAANHPCRDPWCN